MTTATNLSADSLPFLVYRYRDGIVVDCIAGFVSRADALMFVKAAHFPSDFQIYDAASNSVIFDTRGMTNMAVRNWNWRYAA